MRKYSVAIPILGILALVVLFAGMAGSMPSAAAPMAAPTAVSVAASGESARVIELFNARSTVDDVTGPCVDVSAYSKADFYYNVDIDAANVNTTTLTLQHGNSPAALTDGINLVATVAADASDMQQLQVFGAYLCLKIDATDAATGTVIVTANALVK